MVVTFGVLLGACGGDDGDWRTLHLAEIARFKAATENLSLDFGDDRIRRHLVAGWSWDANGRKKGEKFIWGVGDSSTLTFGVAEIRDLEMVFRCRPFKAPDEPPQTVTFTLNGHEIETIELEPKKRQYRLVVPASALVDGENVLTLGYRHHFSPAEVRGGSDSRSLAVAWYDILLHEPGVGVGADEIDDPSGERLRIGLGGRQDYYFRLAAGSHLELRDLELEGASDGRLMVEVETAVDASAETVTRTLFVERGDRIDLPLTPESSSVVRVTLKGVARGESKPGAGLILGRAAVRIPEPVAFAGAVTAGGGQAPSAGKRPNILIYVIDTLRPDRLGAYGHDREISPNIDALAEEGIVVERAQAHAPWTRPSMVSIATGRWPYAHDVNAQRSSLPEDLTTLAELLRDGGYHTVGFISNPQLGKGFGLDQGFEEYHEIWRRNDAYLRDTSRLLYERVAGWLDGDRPVDEPFLLYVHTIDPHAPYTPTGEFRDRFAPDVAEPDLSAEELAVLEEMRESLGRHSYFQTGDLNLGSMPWMIGLEEGRLETTERQTADLLDLYDAEIAINDHWFGELVARLQTADLWEDTLVVLLSDHGEEFGEHDHWEHARTLYRPALEVPLIFKLPAGWKGPSTGRIETAQLVDVLPTVLSVAGLEIPDQAEGEALFVEGADVPAPRPAFSFLNLKGIRATGVVDGRWKLIRNADRESSIELYDLGADPEELRNLAEERPLLVGYLLDLIRQQEIVRGPSTSSGTAIIDEETRRRLEALGYF